MAEVTAEFTGEQAALLEQEAGRRGLSHEALTREEALELLAQREREFGSALEGVLARNRELYRRLA